MKPHIRMINGRWCCCGVGSEGYGPSVAAAYVEWGVAQRWCPDSRSSRHLQVTHNKTTIHIESTAIPAKVSVSGETK